MQTLPTTITRKQLDKLVQTMAGLPSAEIKKTDFCYTVHATKKSTGERVKVFSAISEDGETWTAQAVPGLIKTA